MKSILITTAAALLGTALFTQAEAPAAIKAHVTALHEAKSFKAEITVQKLSGGGLEKGTVSYSKNGLFKIDNATTLAVSDGKMVWILNKQTNTYTEAPASLARTKDLDVWAWAAFFNEEAFKGIKSFTAKPAKTIRGNSLTEYALKLANDKEISIYIDNKTGIARGTITPDVLILASTMAVSKDEIDAKEFAFAAPAGAKKEEVKPSSATFAEVQTILKNSCQGCHNDGNAKAGLSVDSYAGIMKKITAGDAAGSALYRSISGSKPRMPKGGAPLSQKDQDTIAGWINSGAKNE